MKHKLFYHKAEYKYIYFIFFMSSIISDRIKNVGPAEFMYIHTKT